MEDEKFEKGAAPETAKINGERKVFVVEGDLGGLGLSSGDIKHILEKLNQLHLEGVVQTVEEAREIAPTLDISELKEEWGKEDKAKPPRHTKKKGERY